MIKRLKSPVVGFILSVLLTTPYILGHPSGAPENACLSMKPVHGGGIPEQNSTAPYEVVTSALTIGQGQTLRVDILGRSETLSFQGFLIKALNNNNPNEVVGQFNAPSSTVGKLINCDSSVNNAATHTNRNEKTAVTLEWQAPVNFEGQVFFRSTVLQAYDTYWTNVDSDPVQVVAGQFVAVNTTTRAPPVTQAAFVPTPTAAVNTGPVVSDPFYDNCGVSKTCFGMPDNCLNTRTCIVATSVSVPGGVYEFEVLGTDSSAAYAAMALSFDDKMGNDLVTACVRENGQVNVYTSHTSSSPYGTSRVDVPQNTVKMLQSSYNNGAIYCRVQRDVLTTVQNVQYNLKDTNYFLLVAMGSSVGANGVGYHDIGRAVSGRAINLAQVTNLGAASDLLVRLHGCFMIVAWIGTTSLGILLARYFKQTWVGSQLCGKDQWFAWHRICMVITWTLTMVAFVLIFVQLGAWSQEKNPHAILGLVTTILCFFQPIGALFRPAPNDKKRPIFNWLHWLLGNSAHILAIVTIFFAVQLTKAQLPQWMDWILVAYVCCHVIVHLIYSLAGCAADRQQSIQSSFQMNDMGGHPHHHHPAMRNGMKNERRQDAPYAALRKGLLGVYICILVGFVVVLVLLVALAPIETYFENLSS